LCYNFAMYKNASISNVIAACKATMAVIFLGLILSSCSYNTPAEIEEDAPPLFTSADLVNAQKVATLMTTEEVGLNEKAVDSSKAYTLATTTNAITAISPQAVLPGSYGYVVYIRRTATTQQIWTHNQATNKRVKVYEGPEAIGSVAVSGDGSVIAAAIRLVTEQGRNADVYRFTVGGAVEKLTSTPSEERHVSMAASGNVIIWEGDVSGARALFRCTYVSGSCRLIVDGGGSRDLVEPSLSGNAEWFVYIQEKPDGEEILILSSRLLGFPQVLSSASDMLFPSVTNDGKKIAFGRENSDASIDLMLLDRTTNQLVSLFKTNKELRHANISPDGQYLTYSYEAGSHLRLFARNIVSGVQVVLAGDDADYLAAYWQQQPEDSLAERNFRASDVQPNDLFGNAVAIEGNTAVVAAPGQDSGAGAVYVLKRVGGVWGLSKKLLASDRESGDGFGYAVAISGNTIVVGAPYEGDNAANCTRGRCGAVYVFERNLGGTDNWGEAKILVSPLQVNNEDQFGTAVAISRNTVVVSESSSDDDAYVFSRNQGGLGNWGFVKLLTAREGGSLGEAVAISGNTIAVNGSFNGDVAIYLYEQNRGGLNQWGEAQVLTRTQPDTMFGAVLALDNTTLVVGASEDNNYDGATYVFEKNLVNNTWNEVKTLTFTKRGLADDTEFGTSVALSGDRIAVGTFYTFYPGTDRIYLPSYTYVFERNEGGTNNWGETLALRDSTLRWSDGNRSSVAVSSNTVLVGDPVSLGKVIFYE
jgi:Tol biopolymer transport system component